MNKNSRLISALIWIIIIIAIVGSTTWNNLNSSDFSAGTYSNTSYSTTLNAITLTNASNEFPDSQAYNSTTFLNMTGNILLMHMNENAPWEFPNSQTDDSYGTSGINMTGNILLMHTNNDWTDDSGNSNDGTATGTTFATSSKLGSHAGYIEEYGNYVNMSQISGYSASEVTFSAWINPNIASPGQNENIWSNWEDIDNRVYFYRETSTGRIKAYGKENGGVSLTAMVGNVIPTNQWTHIVLTLDSALGESKIYENGVLINSSDYTATTVNENYLGYIHGGSLTSFNGSIDEVAIWNRTLSASEITNIYNQQAPQILDTSGNSNNGTGSGNVNCSATGKLGGYGCEFNGENNYINAGDDSSLNWGSGDGSVCLWFKVNQAASQNLILKGKRYAGGKRYQLSMTSDNILQFNLDDDTSSITGSSDTSFTTGQWTQTCGVREGNNLKIYQNGILVNTTDITGLGSLDDAGILEIGAGNDAAGNPGTELLYNGSIDEVSIWNRGLSAFEVSNIYQQQKGKYHEAGTYISEIKDLTSNQIFNNISWCAKAGELLNNQDGNCGIMNKNVLLLHMNNDWLDTSGYGNNGTAAGATFTTSSKLGSHAGSFNGINYVNISDDSSLDLDSTFTISAWVNTAIIDTTYDVIIGKHESLDAFQFAVNDASSKFYFQVRNTSGTGFTAVSDSALVKDVWYHLVGTIDDSKVIRVYVNGQLQSSTANLIGDINTNNADLLIGTVQSGAFPQYNFNGTLDEIAIWNRTLSESEIQNIYERGLVTLNISVRSCDDAACDTETWNTTTSTSPFDLTTINNRYFQYKFDFISNGSGDLTPEVYNVSLDYSTIVSCTDSDSDGFNTTSSETCGSVIDCDDSNANVVPPTNNLYLTSSTTLCNGTYYINGSVIIANAGDITISGNNTILIGNSTGTAIAGANLNNITFQGFTISNYNAGININGNNSFVQNNNISNCTSYGIITANKVQSNVIENNTLDFNGYAIHLNEGSSYNNVTNNKISNDTGQALSSGIVVNGNSVDAVGNIIFNNTISGSAKYGIAIYTGGATGGINNTFYNNNITDTQVAGIMIYGAGSTGNLIYNNYLDNSINNTLDDGTNNMWNTTETVGTNIIGGPTIGGNYYSDYGGSDSGIDGIGETNYEIIDSTGALKTYDYLPLTTPGTDSTYPLFSNYWDNNGTSDGTTARFNITVENTNGSVYLNIRGIGSYSATNLSSNVYNVSIANAPANIYYYNWSAYGNGSAHNINYSEERTYTIVVADTTLPYFTTIPNNTTINYTQGFGVEFDATDETLLDSYAVNDTTNFEINSSGYLTNTTANMAVGTYLINITINDSSNNLNSTIYQVGINQITSEINTTLNNSQSNITIEIGNSIDLNCSLIAGDSGATLNIYNNGTLSNSGTSPLGNTTTFNFIGEYNITCIYPSTQNYSTSSDTWYVNVTDTLIPYFTTIPANASVQYLTESLGVDFDATDAGVGLDSYAVNDTTNFEINSSGYLTNTTTLEITTYVINITINDTLNNLNSTLYQIDVNDTAGPVITLLAPADSTSATTTAYNFTFNVTDAQNITQCDLILDNTIINSLTNPNKSLTQGLYNDSLTTASHTWSINCTDNFNNVGNSSTRTLTVSSSSGSSSSSSSGGGGGGSSSSSSGGSTPTTSKSECTENSDCEKDQYCYNEKCVKIFDIKIKGIQEKISAGEEFEFTYFVKGMADISDDIVVEFWIEKDGETISSGKDTIYIGNFEEKTETTKLFLPENSEEGVYTLNIRLNYGEYIAESHRTIEIGQSGGVFLPPEKNTAFYLVPLLLLLGILLVGLIIYVERKKIKRSIEENKRSIRSHKYSILALGFLLLIIVGIILLSQFKIIEIVSMKDYYKQISFWLRYNFLALAITIILLAIIIAGIGIKIVTKMKKHKRKPIKGIEKEIPSRHKYLLPQREVNKERAIQPIKKPRRKRSLRERILNKWKRKGYDTEVIETTKKQSALNEIRKWRKEGYDTKILDKKTKKEQLKEWKRKGYDVDALK